MEKIISLLAEKIKAFMEKIDKRDELYAKILQQKKEAEIPETEVKKVMDAVTDAVHRTRCAPPDVTASSELIAEGVVKKLNQSLINELVEQIKTTPFILKQTQIHNHVIAQDLRELADEVLSKRDKVLCCIVLIVGLLIAGFGIWYCQSDNFWGKQYLEIVQSEYITEEEHEALWKNIHAVEALPNEFKTNPGYVKVKIRQNKAVIKERRKEAQKNKGKWAPRVPIER